MRCTKQVLASLGAFLMLTACGGSRPKQFVAEGPPPPLPTYAPSQADRERWAREEAAASAAVNAARAKRDEERRAEQERQRQEEEARVAERDAHPFVFEGQFQAGSDSCPKSRELKFRDIVTALGGVTCEGCRCEFGTKRDEHGTTWTAACTLAKSGKTMQLSRKLIVGNRFAAGSASGAPQWEAAFEETERGSVLPTTCGYAGWMLDRQDLWEHPNTEKDKPGLQYEMSGTSAPAK